MSDTNRPYGGDDGSQERAQKFIAGIPYAHKHSVQGCRACAGEMAEIAVLRNRVDLLISALRAARDDIHLDCCAEGWCHPSCRWLKRLLDSLSAPEGESECLRCLYGLGHEGYPCDGKPSTSRRNAPVMCACHDDGPAMPDGRCATCLLLTNRPRATEGATKEET